MLKPIKESWNDFDQIISNVILENNLSKICEIGAGANPALCDTFIRKHGLNYTLIDIDENELKKSQTKFIQKNIDFTNPSFYVDSQYDLIFSKMVLEHIEHPNVFHKNVYDSLNSGGYSVHFFATLYSFPSILNSILPEYLSNKLLFYFQKRDEEQHGKFPAMYNWCRGPVEKNIRRFEKIGYNIIAYDGYLGHNYLRSNKYLWSFEKFYSKCLVKLQNPYLCSNAILVVTKKEQHF